MGVVAAFVGSTILVSGATDASHSEWALVSGTLLFVVCFIASRTSSHARTKILGVVLAGAATGIGAHATIHVDYFGGSRTLWPIEIVYFLFFGIIPAVAGIYLGRRSTRSR